MNIAELPLDNGGTISLAYPKNLKMSNVELGEVLEFLDIVQRKIKKSVKDRVVNMTVGNIDLSYRKRGPQ